MTFYLQGKEIIIDIDSRLWWVDGMIVSYHLTIEQVLLFKHDKVILVKKLVEKEFTRDSLKYLTIRK